MGAIPKRLTYKLNGTLTSYTSHDVQQILLIMGEAINSNTHMVQPVESLSN